MNDVEANGQVLLIDQSREVLVHKLQNFVFALRVLFEDSLECSVVVGLKRLLVFCLNF